MRTGARAARIGVFVSTLAAASLVGAPTRAPALAAPVRTNATVTSVSAQLSGFVMGVVATPTGKGYWRVTSDGSVLTAGDAHNYGSAAHMWHDIIIAMAATPTGRGYWLVDRSGGIFAFGDAHNYGSMAGKHLNQPIVGMAATPTGNGYWLVASDGGIFTFHAPFKGSMGGKHLNKPIVGMAATPTGLGYWLVASDGGIFTFNAPFEGSMGGRPLNKPVVGMATMPTGLGYTLVASDGGLFRFGANNPFYGSAANACPGAPAVGVATSASTVGYWITFANAQTYAFSPTSHAPICGPATNTLAGQMENDLWTRLNQERAARGLPALKWDPYLGSYAAGWSANMASNGFRHSDIGVLLGTYNAVGENIAMGSKGVPVGSLHNAWMHSDGHRANMLSPAYTNVGIGAYCGSDGSVWLTQEFGHLTSAGPAPVPSGTPPVDPVVRSDSGTLTC